MLRRDFLRLMAAAAPAVGIGGRALFAQSEESVWRTYEVTTSVRVLKPSGRTRIWLPQPLADNTGFQKLISSSVQCDGGRTSIHEDRAGGNENAHGRFSHRSPPRFGHDATHRYAQLVCRFGDAFSGTHHAVSHDVARFLQPTRYVPTDGIVKETADKITKGAATDVEKVRAIYEWIVENTYRNPKVRGCGRGDIRPMLEMGDLGGKCADLNALFVGLVKASGIPARDVYGIRIGPSNLESKCLGTSSDRVEKAQHCRAEVYLSGFGWVPMDPADVRKVVLEEPPGNLAITDSKVEAARKRLFGSWEMNWMAYNYAQDIVLPGSSGPSLPFLMYPQAETEEGRLDSLDAVNFRYEITSRELAAV